MSHLQRVASKLNNLMNHKLRHIHKLDIAKSTIDINLSESTLKLIEKSNEINTKIRISIESDYRLYETKYRKEHKWSLPKNEKQFDG